MAMTPPNETLESVMARAHSYLGVKIVKAAPLLLGDYNTLRGWQIPANEDPMAQGYLVKYTDGYISWCPKEQFEETNEPSTGMSFGHAIEALKKGKKVARVGWNGKDMFLFLVPGSNFLVNRPPLLGIYPEGTEINYCPHIDMKTADGKVVPWLASQTDMLASDWCIV